jgi:hypothetical protein
MAIVAYTLAQAIHFADTTDLLGDTSGAANDVLVLDTLANVGTVYRAGVLNGTPFPFTAARAATLVTAGALTANATYSGVPAAAAPATGWTAVTGWTAASKQGFTASTTATLLGVSQALAALIADLTAAGIIGV